MTEGDDVSLDCVSGCPTPINIVWFRDGQRVPKPVFQAGREDTGRYHCAVLEQETVRSASVALNVQCKYMNNTTKKIKVVMKCSCFSVILKPKSHPKHSDVLAVCR